LESLYHVLLVEAGVTDPERVRRDLAARRFATVILYENVFETRPPSKTAEVPSLPQAQLDEVRKHYRLVRHVDGPYLNGDYVYQPIND
jgi:hypothetical protein